MLTGTDSCGWAYQQVMKMKCPNLPAGPQQWIDYATHAVTHDVFETDVAASRDLVSPSPLTWP